MKTIDKLEEHRTLDGQVISLADLDDEARQILDQLHGFLDTKPDWTVFGNFWPPKVLGYFEAHGVSRRVATKSALYRVAQDLESRLGVDQGFVKKPASKPDYREQLAEIIAARFSTRREFCQATGIAEDLLSHVLAGRKHLAIDTLTAALERIGYRLQIVPMDKK